MLDFPTWKKAWLWFVTLACVVAALPSIVILSGASWPSALPSPQVNLGLDLAGGSYILLEADPAQVRRQRLETMEEQVRGELDRASPKIEYGDMSTANGRLSFLLSDPGQVDAAREELLPLVNGTSVQREWNLDVVDGSRIVITPSNSGLETALDSAMDGAMEVVRNRIDELGTREPTIVREGDTRIVVQVPGLDNPDELKALIGKTAKLEFKMVDELADPSAPPPAGRELIPYAPGTREAGTSVIVKRLGGIRGDSLVRAQAGNDPQTNAAVVDIQFDQQGGAKFAKLTSENVGKRFAIILDGQALSAPSINEPIIGGRAQISGSFNAETANQLAIQLVSGALPVDLKVVDESNVSAELGADSIEKGSIAFLVGTLALMAFIILSYGRFGVYACVALLINVLMILGIMAVFGSTLTLPGIAGFVLTIGAAVDANVLINERIREERARGRKVVAAVEAGYKEASRAIFDANITNVIAAVLMAVIGSGPVRGFAIVLIIGIATSVFTAVTLTRMWVAGWLRRARPTDLVL